MIWQNYPHYASGTVTLTPSAPIYRPPGVWINVCAYTRTRYPQLDFEPVLDECERMIARTFLRRYVTYCARRGKFASMEGARALWSKV